LNCARCDKKDCYQGKDCTKIKELAISQYQKEELKIVKTSTLLEGNYYMKLARLEELKKFAKLMNYKYLGIAFCIGLSDEAKVLTKVLEKDFKISSVCCKLCGIKKEKFKLSKIKTSRVEAMCNPIGQAMVFNMEKTDLNIILGLCIGHDILFTKYSQAPVTTLVVKDRVLGHNPVAALYSGYYKRKLLAAKKRK
jgi:uncharacterized metal-binding protein